MPRLEFGQIIKARRNDPQGANRKRRDWVIVSRTDEIVRLGTFVAVAITGEVPNGLTQSNDECVLLRYQAPPNAPHPETKLYKRCAAMCTWLEAFTPDDVEEFGGRLDNKEMSAIMRNLKRILDKKRELGEFPNTSND